MSNAVGVKKLNICLTNNLYRAVSHVSATHGLSISFIVRNALKEMPADKLTKYHANAVGGGFYRTIINLSEVEFDLLNKYSEFSELGKSSVIRAALGQYLLHFFK